MENQEEQFGGGDKYTPISLNGKTGLPMTVAYFMTRSLLASRVELGLSTDGPPEEQDVNIYLVNLLGAYAEPKHFLETAPYLANYDHDLFARLQYSISARFKYQVYRANADYLLMNVGLFAPYDRERRTHWWGQGSVNAMGRGQAYYDYAASFGSSVFGAHNGVPEVLGKLSVGFAKYVRLLRHLRGEYLNMIEHLSEADFHDLAQSAQAKGLEELHDEFLDALRAYQKQLTPERRASLLLTVQNIQKVDPHFQFNLPADNG